MHYLEPKVTFCKAFIHNEASEIHLQSSRFNRQDLRNSGHRQGPGYSGTEPIDPYSYKN